MNMPAKVRIDKWLWAVRRFKTRTAATDACKSGKVRVNGVTAKASSTVETGALVEIRTREGKVVLRVLELLERRVGAQQAQACYEDLSPPPESSDAGRPAFYGSSERRERGTGRPTKRDRREIDRFKEGE